MIATGNLIALTSERNGPRGFARLVEGSGIALRAALSPQITLNRLHQRQPLQRNQRIP